jgi:hypothetical protein
VHGRRSHTGGTVAGRWSLKPAIGREGVAATGIRNAFEAVGMVVWKLKQKEVHPQLDLPSSSDV